MSLRGVCEANAALMPALMHNGVPCDPALVLWAFAGVESSYGRDREVPRHEHAYAPGGMLYRSSPAIRSQYAQYGPDAACSWGTWQMMFATARDLGFLGSPGELREDAVLAPLVCRFMRRCEGLTLENCADAYNSGNWRDSSVPLDYMAKVVSAYEKGWPAA